MFSAMREKLSREKGLKNQEDEKYFSNFAGVGAYIWFDARFKKLNPAFIKDGVQIWIESSSIFTLVWKP